MTIIDFIFENTKWIFSGIGVFVISLLYYKKRSKEGKGGVVVNNFIQTSTDSEKGVSTQFLMQHTFILFVDDDTFSVVNILKEQGWKETRMVKDVKNLNDERVTQAHIIFVDINGVGKMLFPEKQGIGLANALKNRYPEKKIVIYSASRAGDRFDDELQNVDYRLPKDAEPYRFVQLVEKFAKEVHGKGNH